MSYLIFVKTIYMKTTNKILIVSILFLSFIESKAQRFLPLIPEGNDILTYAGPDGHITGFTTYNDKLLFCGRFQEVAGEDRVKICYWNGSDYEAFDQALPQMSSTNFPYGFLNTNDGFILYGRMNVMNNVSLFNGSEFQGLGEGLDDRVYDMVEYNGSAIAGGRFTFSGENEALHVAMWNGSNWEQMGDGFNDDVNSLIVFDDELYAAGNFTMSGGTEVARIAKWNGSSWEQVGDGVDDTAYALETHEGELYMSGDFENSADGMNSLNSLIRIEGDDLVGILSDDQTYSLEFLNSLDGNLYAFGGTWSFQQASLGYTLEGSTLNPLQFGTSLPAKDHFWNGALYTNNEYSSQVSDPKLFYQDNPILEYSLDGSLIDYLNSDNSQIQFFPGGSVFNDFGGGAQYFVGNPEDQVSSIYSIAPWMGGIVEEELHMSYQSSHFFDDQDLNRYFFGPFSNSYDAEFAKRYMRVWKVTSEQVQDHIDNFDQPGYEIPEVIENWPGNGRTEFGESSHIAPFEDMDENGLYEPESGDYPLIRGDQALYYILSTSRDGIAANSTSGIELGVMAYKIDDPDPNQQHSTFVSYQLTNRSDLNYEEFNFGMYHDIDLGNPIDDFVGCDSSLHMMFGYNGDNNDEASSSSPGFQDSIPVQGLSFLSDDMVSHVYYNNSNGINGDPSLPIHHFNYLNALWKDGSPVLFGGDGYTEGSGADPDQPVSFMYPSSPIESTNDSTWSEVSVGNFPGDRRQVGAIAPFPLAPGEEKCIDIALITAFPESVEEGLDSSMPLIVSRTQAIRDYYSGQNYECGSEEFPINIESVTREENSMLIYPNPSQSGVNIESKTRSIETIRLLDLNGRLLLDQAVNDLATRLDLSAFRPGLYLVSIELEGQKMITEKLIIEQ